MDFLSLFDSLKLIKPEITVSITLLVVLILDLIFNENKKIVWIFSIIGIVIALVFTANEFTSQNYAFTPSNGGHNFGLLTIDSFGAFFKVLILVSTLLILYFSNNSIEVLNTGKRQGEFYILIFGMVLGMMFLVSASDLIMIYLSMELLSLPSYVLAGFLKLRERNSEASLKYLLYGAASSGFMLFGISLIYGLTGSTNLHLINLYLQFPQMNYITFALASIMIFAGIGFKISSAPFHFWTPDVYEGAPVSITAFLSVASKAAGFAVLIRLIKTSFVLGVNEQGSWILSDVFNWQTLLAAASILTMTLGNFTALWQNNLKRMLAYSSIAHAGYMLLGITVLSTQGVIAILMYFAFYMLMNIGAFFVVSLIADKMHTEDIHEYNGLGYKSPWLAALLSIFLISLTGLPPTAGFIGKLYLFIALVDSNMITLAVIALLNSVVSLYYYVRVIKHMYLKKPEGEVETFKPSFVNLTFTFILAAAVLIFGIYFSPIANLAKQSISILGL